MFLEEFEPIIQGKQKRAAPALCPSQFGCSDVRYPRSFLKALYFIGLRQERQISFSEDIFGCTRLKGSEKTKAMV